MRCPCAWSHGAGEGVIPFVAEELVDEEEKKKKKERRRIRRKGYLLHISSRHYREGEE